MIELNSKPRISEKNIVSTLSSITESIVKLEDQCTDCCLSCRNFGSKVVGNNFLGVNMPICTSKHNWHVHDRYSISCDAGGTRYQMFHEYIPTQNFLKLKLRTLLIIKEMKKLLCPLMEQCGTQHKYEEEL